MSADGCGAPAGGAARPADVGNQAVVEGRVTRGGAAVAVGYARLLNDGGEFVAEVPLGADGGFRFFAAPGSWTVRVLAPGGVSTDRPVTAETPLDGAGPAPVRPGEVPACSSVRQVSLTCAFTCVSSSLPIKGRWPGRWQPGR